MRIATAAILITYLALQGCGSGPSSSRYASETQSDGESEEEETGEDESVAGNTSEEEDSEGSSSGNVHYYNPSTGTNSDYTLDVEHNGAGDVERINFDHGGYIDESHITDQEHNGDGTITVSTDSGAEYTVEESSDNDESDD